MKCGNGITIGYLRDRPVTQGQYQRRLSRRRFAIAPHLPALITKM